MPRLKFHQILATGLLCAVAACHDTRRDAVGKYLAENPPAAMETISIGEKFRFEKQPDGRATTRVSAHYRLTTPTVVLIDGLATGEGRAIVRRAADVRRWALASLPPGHPLREEITGQGPPIELTLKRIVEPAGTEFDAVASLSLEKASDDTWRVTELENSLTVRGVPDQPDGVLREGSKEAESAIRELASFASGLEGLKENYLAERRRTAERSLEILRARLKSGQTFEGTIGGSRKPIRLIVSTGLDAGDTVSAVFTDRATPESSARYSGKLMQQPSGEYVWRATLAETLSAPENPGGALFQADGARPTLLLRGDAAGLTGELREPGDIPPSPLELRDAGEVDLIPEPAAPSA